ncbi:MAG: lipid A-modifier LpxR family protein [Dissulfuribacterales bacterium]
MEIFQFGRSAALTQRKTNKICDTHQKKIGIQFFAGVEGRAVLYNIFLDGNTFTDSPSVDKKPIVADFMTGISISRGPIQLSFAYVNRTKKFETQKKAQNFGILGVLICLFHINEGGFVKSCLCRFAVFLQEVSRFL